MNQKACRGAEDCQSSVCADALCIAPACTDGIKNGMESDVDCGGSGCNKCGHQKACAGPADCASGVCDTAVCVAPPTVATLSPIRARTAGGVDVTLTGTGFAVLAADMTVTFGGVAGTGKSITATSMVVTVPASGGKLGPVDVVVTHKNGGKVTAAGAFAYFASAPTFGAKVDYATAGSGADITAADVSGDNNLDLIFTSEPSNLSIMFGKGDGAFDARVDYPGTGFRPIGVGVGDLNGDGKPDITVASSGTNQLRLYMNKGDGTFGAPTPLSTGTDPVWVAVVDLNADNKLDLVTQHVNFERVGVFLGKGVGPFNVRKDVPLPGFSPGSVVAGDVNGDGKPDLCVGSSGADSVLLLLGKGDGTFIGGSAYDGQNERERAAALLETDGGISVFRDVQG